ncbi:isoprenylcysteine carboxylmethyltransferase family protein [Thermococcus sp.]|uniref:methyltransferase family protein n=1 Tax=Thermococcus sp. TaxID=35749 RepID=UPI0026269CB5|nr:isoprenylcysteine carboxylmethyltransferase family protein [Thermococcus sp.]
MRFWGIEPKVALVAGPYALLAFYLNVQFGINLAFPVVGVPLLVAGLALWLLCYSQIVRVYEGGELLKKGCYSKVRHPIYSIWGFLILPGFSLSIGGFMLLLPLVYWLSVVGFIEDEEKALEERFGEEWIKYRKKTPRFIPKP